MTYPDDAALAAWINADLERRRQARLRAQHIMTDTYDPSSISDDDRAYAAFQRAVRLHVMRALWTDAGKPALSTLTT